MSEVEIVALAKQALTTVLLVAGPALGMGLIVGLTVSIFQATTQIQEQTLTFIPKIIAVLASILLFGPWMLRVLVNFGSQVLENLHNFVA
ncbi:MAG: flagellar biosynthesis protein FliQ [Firmicutes bacterium]|nr:flagellar biosynthesis protein FliQ [Bacillota bacterium]NLL88078.1 flagellar biosynthesis protein FliQ [Bacillota bacterium]